MSCHACLQSTYYPPDSTHSSDYQPTGTNAHDDPFRLRDSDNPFAGTLAGHAEVVPVPEHSSVTIQTGAQPGNVVLQFQGKCTGQEVLPSCIMRGFAAALLGD